MHRVRHAAAEARGAEAAPFTGEGDEPLEAASLAADAHAAVLEQAATQVLVHLALHEAMQASRFFGPLAGLRQWQRIAEVTVRLGYLAEKSGLRPWLKIVRIIAKSGALSAARHAPRASLGVAWKPRPRSK